MNINIAILEDNKSHYNKLRRFLENWAVKTKYTLCIQHFEHGDAILCSEFMKDCNLLFSDIRLAPSNIVNENGISICMQLREKGFHGDIIFLTAFREYVFDGYQAQAINYLLKPISEEIVNNCMDKYITMHGFNFYYLHKADKHIRIPYNDIISISKADHDCCITTATELFAERTTLQNIEKQLPKQFLRCHKSCIVNINHIISLSGSIMKLTNKQTQHVGRLYQESLKKALIKTATDI